MNEQPIPPALTPDEWQRKSTRSNTIRVNGNVLEIVTDCGGFNTIATVYPSELPALVALANDARPDHDDDPGKITPDDVAWLKDVLEAVSATDNLAFLVTIEGRPLVEKLASILREEMP